MIDLTGESGREAHAAERLAEDKRLLYVALTRAQLKLYLPYYLYEKDYTWVGPVCRILAPGVRAQFHREGEAGGGTETAGVVWLTPEAVLGGGAADTPPETMNVLDSNLDAQSVTLPAQPRYLQRRPPMASFTRLHRLAAGAYSTEAEAVSLFDGGTGRIPVEGGSGKGGSDEVSTAVWVGEAEPEQTHAADRLPGGANMGSLCHDILETIDYGAVRRAATAADLDPDCRALILKQMRSYQVDAAWAPDLAELVWNTLNTPVRNTDAPLVLGDLPADSRLHEVAFTCCLGLDVKKRQEANEGYLRGFIDLLFVHEGRYYILDWKSNRLDTGYGAESLAAGMDAAGYHLQYRIYTLAALRWLSLRLGPAFNASAHFGGVYYIYLRGMGRAPGSGVFFTPPASIGAVETLEAVLVRHLEGCHAC